MFSNRIADELQTNHRCAKFKKCTFEMFNLLQINYFWSILRLLVALFLGGKLHVLS